MVAIRSRSNAVAVVTGWESLREGAACLQRSRSDDEPIGTSLITTPTTITFRERCLRGAVVTAHKNSRRALADRGSSISML